jgi:hypothetical protein
MKTQLQQDLQQLKENGLFTLRQINTIQPQMRFARN